MSNLLRQNHFIYFVCVTCVNCFLYLQILKMNLLVQIYNEMDYLTRNEFRKCNNYHIKKTLFITPLQGCWICKCKFVFWGVHYHFCKKWVSPEERTKLIRIQFWMWKCTFVICRTTIRTYKTLALFGLCATVLHHSHVNLTFSCLDLSFDNSILASCN